MIIHDISRDYERQFIKRNYCQNRAIPTILFSIEMDYPIDNVGLLVGSASAILLISLEWAATTRETNLWIIWLLPIGGLISGLLYHYLGQRLEKGNNLIIEETSKPYKNIEKDIEALSISILKEDESTITSDFTKKDAYLNEAMHVIKEIN